MRYAEGQGVPQDYGEAVKWYTALQTDYFSWVWLSIVYGIVYMPTLALSNSLAFALISPTVIEQRTQEGPRHIEAPLDAKAPITYC